MAYTDINLHSFDRRKGLNKRRIARYLIFNNVTCPRILRLSSVSYGNIYVDIISTCVENIVFNSHILLEMYANGSQVP